MCWVQFVSQVCSHVLGDVVLSLAAAYTRGPLPPLRE